MLPNWENCAPNGPKRAALGGPMLAPRAGAGGYCPPGGLRRTGYGRLPTAHGRAVSRSTHLLLTSIITILLLSDVFYYYPSLNNVLYDIINLLYVYL